MEDKAYFYSTTNQEQQGQNTCSPGSQCYPCNPCSPDRIQEDGTQCYPCNPCSPDRITSDGQCYPCNPCSPDRITNDGQCYPCNPCSPDRLTDTGQCYPCNPCSPDRVSSSDNSGSSGGCYISTACTSSMGLPDDCYELQLLRAFRDKRARYDEDFRKTVEDYYKFAPLIVSKIDKEEERKEIYEYLYKNLVSPCVKLILENKEIDAMNHYKGIVYSLKDRYGF